MIVGRIYFVSAPGRIKIGYTRQPDKRLASLRAVDMEELTTLGVVPGTRDLEQALHSRVRAYQIRGEWFVDCQAVREAVNDALAGKYQVDEQPEPEADITANEIPVGEIVLAAVQESKRIASEIQDRIAARKDISDLITSALFLAEHVIAPAMRV